MRSLTEETEGTVLHGATEQRRRTEVTPVPPASGRLGGWSDARITSNLTCDRL